MPDLRIKDLTTTSAAPAPDDFMETDGAAQGGRKLRAGAFNEWDAARAVAGYVLIDGTTPNRGAIYSPGTRGAIAGLAALTLLVDFVVPASNPAARIVVWASGPSATPADPYNTAGNFVLFIETNGNLQLRQIGPTGADQRQYGWTGFRSSFSGQRVRGRVVVAPGVDPVGEFQGASFAGAVVAPVGAPSDWLVGISSACWFPGYNWIAGEMPIVVPINGTLTAAEAEAWRLTGRLPGWAVPGGSQNLLAPEPTSFEGGTVGGWVQVGNHTRAVVADGGGLGANALEVVAGGAGAWATDAVYVVWAGPRVIGQTYRVRFLAKSVSGNTAVTCTGNLLGSRTLTGAWQEFVSNDFVPTTTGTITIGFFLGGVGTFRIDNIRMEVVGALTIPRVQPIGVLADSSALSGNPGRLVGCVPVTEDRRWTAMGITSTSGNQQLFGGDVFDSARDVIDSIEQVPRTGTPTTSVGSASGGAQYKASGALAAGVNPATLVTRKLASNGVWVASNSTDEVVTTITGHRVGA